ncbi:MAG: phosphotransferase, partial [Burkholderiales bacterium]|nr:phosphotransferase [Burkholderiales bacterium]
MNTPSAHPYDALTPERVLDAIESLGLRCDGYLQALNSYENRVYQIGLVDGAPVVAKFYRPARWTEAQILEEHEFAFELAEREIPVVTPLRFDGASLHRYQGFLFAVYPRRGGRAPDLEDEQTLE